ncbi:MAG: metallophosphoesterase [Parachlamydiaceae bacterium]|nr:metallophosphoesterase [Parachlamydiaceae bacterium]
MKIAVVNDIHVGKSLVHNGKVRASSHLIEDIFEDFLQDIQQQHCPDVLINLGDLIRSESKESDLQAYRRLVGNFGQFCSPVIHLLGNHELKKMSLRDIESIWQECGFNQKSYGCKDVGDFTLIWLGLELNPEDLRARALPSEQLSWLKRQLSQNSRLTIIFTHCAIDDHDVSGNFFYEASDKRSKTGLFLENQESIRKAISASGCVIAVLQAHLHYFHSKQIDGIPYITCPAMGDNICGPNIRDNIPEIYTILTFDKNQLTAKAFSGKYCFAGYERN